MNSDLQARWTAMWEQWGEAGRTLGGGLFEEMVARYGEMGRSYHNLEHLRFCFRELDRGGHAVEVKVEMALWFHDVVYDAKAKTNEEDSVRFFQEKTREMDWGSSWRDTVCELIMVTKNHAAGDQPAARLICDVDLAILGQEPEAYHLYEQQIREEYAWVDPVRYGQGRGAVLLGFLVRPRIYVTDDFYSRYEAAARKNMSGALGALVDG